MSFQIVKLCERCELALSSPLVHFSSLRLRAATGHRDETVPPRLLVSAVWDEELMSLFLSNMVLAFSQNSKKLIRIWDDDRLLAQVLDVHTYFNAGFFEPVSKAIS